MGALSLGAAAESCKEFIDDPKLIRQSVGLNSQSSPLNHAFKNMLQHHLSLFFTERIKLIRTV